jgi:hypothetical protein
MNKLVGEEEITLGETTYVLRPSWQALAEIESRTDKGIIELFELFAVARNKASDTVIIIYSCLRAGLPPGMPTPQIAAVGQLLYEMNVVHLGPLAQRLLSTIVAQGREPKEEQKKT